MQTWYSNYWSQLWYRNTFLIHDPTQIARAIKKPREWNSVSDSGCNFTCLAMIIEIDPGRLASALSTVPKFFRPDRCIPAKTLAQKPTYLTWDKNAPESARPAVIKDLWHPKFGRCDVTLNFVDPEPEPTSDIRVAEALIRSARALGQHIVCGPHNHSLLVAGEGPSGFFLWDPEAKLSAIEKMMSGGILLKSLFRRGAPAVEFYIYSLKILPRKA